MLSLSGCSKISFNKKSNVVTESATISELNDTNAIIGVTVGSSYAQLCQQVFNKATIEYYNTYTDMAERVKNGALSAFVIDYASGVLVCNEVDGIRILDEMLEPAEYGIVFDKTERGRKLLGEFNEFLSTKTETGYLEEIQKIWINETDESCKIVDQISKKGPRGTLSLAVEPVSAPFTYIRGNQVVGYDIAVVTDFCKEYGYGLDIVVTNFMGMFPGLKAGLYDCGASGITITEERKESFNFSSPICSGGTSIIVRSSSDKGKFFKNLITNIDKTFIRESRWKLIVNGIYTTIFISIVSSIFGTLFGFLLCAMRLSRNKLIDGIAIAFIRIMQGLPMLVHLMILFYVVFAKSGFSGVTVAIIGFGMNFGAFVSEMIRTGILAVDKGQMEAALALGYKKPQAFMKIVLPQAAQHFLPVYQGEFISLVKMTSVVGYIAIQDLTKAGDIIRSRTYEAFFPMLVTAVIYFLVAWILTRILVFIQNKLDPKKRKRSAKK